RVLAVHSFPTRRSSDLEHEMTARAEEMRARVVEAEAEVPMALAEALRSGKMGVMDYLNYQNINADTDMRNQIGGKNEKDYHDESDRKSTRLNSSHVSIS